MTCTFQFVNCTSRDTFVNPNIRAFAPASDVSEQIKNIRGNKIVESKIYIYNDSTSKKWVVVHRRWNYDEVENTDLVNAFDF